MSFQKGFQKKSFQKFSLQTNHRSSKCMQAMYPRLSHSFLWLWYLAWRIATELHQSIKYSFLISGLLNLVWIIASESWKGPIRSVYNLWTCSNGGHIKQHRGEQSPARIDARWPCIISCIRLVYFSGIIFKKKSRTMHLCCDIQMRNNIKSKLSWLSVANHVAPWVNKLHLHFLC